MQTDTLIRELRDGSGCRLVAGASLADMSTWRIGGAADLVAVARSMEDAAQVFLACGRASLPVTLVGGGSNLLYDDRGLRGVALTMCRGCESIHVRGSRLTASAGAEMTRVARVAARAGLAGLEHASNIPGTIGGLVVMNGGSNRLSIGDHLVRVRAMDRQGVQYEFARADCGFAYRTSVFQELGMLVAEVELELVPAPPGEILARIEEDLAVRRSKFPLDQPSCGSVFKSSPDLYQAFGPPGMVIDRLGLKGLTVGGVQVSPRHANFFVNLGGATSAQVMELVAMVRDRVLAETGFELECEVRHVSPDGDIAPLHLRLRQDG